MSNTTVWIATVDTRYEWVAVDTDPEVAIAKACEAAYEWLVEVGVTEHESPAAVREYFGVQAYAVPVGTAVMIANAAHHG
jgi:hypothetical protein